MPGDANGLADVFLHDSTTGVTRLVSRNASGGSANSGSSEVRISADGSYLPFTSAATNLAGAAYSGETPGDLVYRYNIATGRITLVSRTPRGAVPNAAAFVGDISANGRYVAYSARAHDIVPGDHNGVHDAFRYDATTDKSITVSLPSVGRRPTRTPTPWPSVEAAATSRGRPRRRTGVPPTPTTTRTPTSTTPRAARAGS